MKARRVKRKITIEELREDITLRKEHYKIMEKYPNELGETFEYFIDMLILAGKSYNTVRAYYNDLCTFFDFLKEVYPTITSLNQIEKIHVNRYYRYCQSTRKNGNAALNRKHKFLDMFFRVLEEQGVITADEIPIPKKDSLKQKSKPNNKLPVYAEECELDELFELILEEKNEFQRYRDYCMFSLLFYSGMRISELLSLDVDDIENLRKNGYFRVVGKGDKERSIPIHTSAFEVGHLRYFDNYLRVRELNLNPKLYPEDIDALFISREGNRLIDKTPQTKIKKYIKKLGMKKELTPHKLRHSFASHLLKMGVNIRVVQELLGHASVSTTQIYAHISDQDKKKAAELMISNKS